MSLSRRIRLYAKRACEYWKLFFYFPFSSESFARLSKTEKVKNVLRSCVVTATFSGFSETTAYLPFTPDYFYLYPHRIDGSYLSLLSLYE